MPAKRTAPIEADIDDWQGRDEEGNYSSLVPWWAAPVLSTVLERMRQCASELCGRDATGTDAAPMSVSTVLASRRYGRTQSAIRHAVALIRADTAREQGAGHEQAPRRSSTACCHQQLLQSSVFSLV